MDGALHAHAFLAILFDESASKFLSLLQVHGKQGVQQDLACQFKSEFKVSLSCSVFGCRATQQPRALLRG